MISGFDDVDRIVFGVPNAVFAIAKGGAAEDATDVEAAITLAVYDAFPEALAVVHHIMPCDCGAEPAHDAIHVSVACPSVWSALKLFRQQDAIKARASYAYGEAHRKSIGVRVKPMSGPLRAQAARIANTVEQAMAQHAAGVT